MTSAESALNDFCKSSDGSRCLVVAAHPDDETAGLGGQFLRLNNIRFLHATDGSPKNGVDAARHGFSTPEEYAHARRKEFLSALATAGLTRAPTDRLGFYDQELALQLPELIFALRTYMQSAQPSIVITHPYEGGHPDHDALAFAVAQAVKGLEIVTIEFSGYHNGPNGIDTASFVPPRENSADLEDTPTRVLQLTSYQQYLKRRMYDCFETQLSTLEYFGVAEERFRVAPQYDFTKPPHSGPLFYDQFPWGVTSAEMLQSIRRTLAGTGAYTA